MPDANVNQQSTATGKTPVDLRESGAELSDPRVLLPEWLRDRLPHGSSPAPATSTTMAPVNEQPTPSKEEPLPSPPMAATSRESAGWPPLPPTAIAPLSPSALLSDTRLPTWLRDIAGESAEPLPSANQTSSTPVSPVTVAAFERPGPALAELLDLDEKAPLPSENATVSVDTPVAVAMIVAVLLILILAIWSLYS